jgi:hypothetical protein
MGALGDLGYDHQPLLDALTGRVVPARLPEFSLDHLSDLVQDLNKLGWVAAGRRRGGRAAGGGVGRLRARFVRTGQ